MLPAVLFCTAAGFRFDRQRFGTADQSAAEIGYAGRNRDSGKIPAKRKGTVADRVYTAGNYHFRQVPEGTKASLDGRNTFRNLQFRDAQVIKVIHNLRHPGRNMKPHRVPVIPEGGVFQSGHAVRKFNRGQVITAEKLYPQSFILPRSRFLITSLTQRLL